MVIEKNAKKKFFRKTWLTEKLKYTENREFSKTFFPYSFLKLNYLQAHIKKIEKKKKQLNICALETLRF